MSFCFINPIFTEILIMVINMTSFQLFQIFKEKVGETEAADLVAFIINKIKEKDQTNLNLLTTKAGIPEVN